MHFISSAFLQINSRVQVVTQRPACERKNIISPARDGITRDYFYSILHGRAKRRIARYCTIGDFPRTRISLLILTSFVLTTSESRERNSAAWRNASLLNIQPNTPADWLLIIGVASRTRITINFVYCACAAPWFSHRSIVDQPRTPSHKSNTSRS